MSDTGAAERSLLHHAWRGAAALVALDALVYGALLAIGWLTGSPAREALAAWVWFHEPAFRLADAVLPQPETAQPAIPVTSLLGLLALLALQAALIGALLGAAVTLAARLRHPARPAERAAIRAPA